MARKRYRRRRKGSSHTSVAKVKAIVKKEVGKTRESHKLVTYMKWAKVSELIDKINNPTHGIICSLTGGVDPFQTSNLQQQPQTSTIPSIFVLRPSMYPDGIGGESGVNTAGQGGMAIDPSTLTGDSPIGGIYSLEGRQCYLRTWYAHILFRNVLPNAEPSFVRMVVFETRRPLGSRNLAQQILLQNHAVAGVAVPSPGSQQGQPETVVGFLNRAQCKKVYVDKLIKLTLSGASGQIQSHRLRVKINKKAHWQYMYATDDPALQGSKIIYQGPWIYVIFFSDKTFAQAAIQPQVCFDSMLTFYDD